MPDGNLPREIATIYYYVYCRHLTRSSREQKTIVSIRKSVRVFRQRCTYTTQCGKAIVLIAGRYKAFSPCKPRKPITFLSYNDETSSDAYYNISILLLLYNCRNRIIGGCENGTVANVPT